MDQTRLNFFKNYKFLKTNNEKSRFNQYYNTIVKYDIKLSMTEFIYSHEIYNTNTKSFKNNKKIKQRINSISIYNKSGFKKHSIYF